MSSLYNVLYSAATGDVSPDQVNQLTQDETSNLIQAGADPSTASSDAANDVNTTLATYSGTGGLGLTWTGAAPGQSFTSAATSWLKANWIWIALAVVLLLGFLAFAYGGFGLR